MTVPINVARHIKINVMECYCYYFKVDQTYSEGLSSSKPYEKYFLNKLFLKFLTFYIYIVLRLLLSNYYYPGVVPSCAKCQTPDTMFTTLSHRLISSLAAADVLLY